MEGMTGGNRRRADATGQSHAGADQLGESQREREEDRPLAAIKRERPPMPG